MTVKILLAVLLVASLATCRDGPPEGPADTHADGHAHDRAEATPEAPAESPAERCAEAVRIYQDVQSPVVIVGQSVKTPEGSVGVEIVEIEYEGTDAMNVPVKGSANCTFVESTLGLLLVDGPLVDAQGLDSIRGEL